MAEIKTVKATIGLRRSYWFPIQSEADNALPTYGAKTDMGANVKAYLSLTTAGGEVRGDDIAQVSTEVFVSGQVDSETTFDDLELNAKLYGHTYSTADGETSSSDDNPPDGGYAYIQVLLAKDKSLIYRAVCYPKTTAMMSAEKSEADTKPSGDLAVKNYPVSFRIQEAKNGVWRKRKDFDSQADAESFIDTVFSAT